MGSKRDLRGFSVYVFGERGGKGGTRRTRSAKKKEER